MRIRYLSAAAALALAAAACTSMNDGAGTDASTSGSSSSPSTSGATTGALDAGPGAAAGTGVGSTYGGTASGATSGAPMGADPGMGAAGAGATAGGATASAGGAADIVTVAQGAGQFSTLVSAIQTAGLVETLKGPGPYTVFAPTDAAFKAMPQSLLTQLMEPANKGRLVSVLSYHVVPGKLASSDLRAGQSLTTVQGGKLALTGSGSTLKVNGANVVSADVPASNGVVHAIDKVLVPTAKPS